MNGWLPINDRLPENSGSSSPLLWLYAGEVLLGRYVKNSDPANTEFTGFSDEHGRPVVASHYRYREPDEEPPAAP